MKKELISANYGYAIKILRVINSLTQQELADKIGVEHNMIYRIENNLFTSFRFDILNKIMKKFNISIVDFRIITRLTNKEITTKLFKK